MPTIEIISRSGESQVFSADEDISLMEAIRDSGSNEIEALCGGCCSCATCHVYIDAAHTDRLPPASEDEKILLEGSEHWVKERSRLACQIQLSEKLEGLKVQVAPED